VGPTVARLKLWAQKWLWYETNSLPWNRARIHWEFMRREAFVRWPVHGNVLAALREGRLEIGAQTLLEPGVWITAPGSARVRIGSTSRSKVTGTDSPALRTEVPASKLAAIGMRPKNSRRIRWRLDPFRLTSAPAVEQ